MWERMRMPVTLPVTPASFLETFLVPWSKLVFAQLICVVSAPSHYELQDDYAKGKNFV